MGVRMVAGELLLGFAAAGVDLPPLPAASPTHCCPPNAYSTHTRKLTHTAHCWIGYSVPKTLVEL